MTTVKLAELLKVDRRTVVRWCQQLGYEREGRDFILTAAQVREISKHVRPGPGRPPKGKGTK